MTANQRREKILSTLINEKKAITGSELAANFKVTRQVIVKDIAILRAEGKNIIATPDGYMLNDNYSNRVKSIIAVCHNEDDMIKELEIVVKYGGIIEDVIIEHPLYGEIKGMLKIKNLNDLNKFTDYFEKSFAKPLSALTKGIHLHTISADSEENMNYIKDELKEKGFIL